MAIELGAAYLSILPSTDQLAPGIKKSLGGVQKVTDAAGKDMGKTLAAGITKGTSGVQDVIKGSLKQGTKTARSEGQAAGKQFSNGVAAGSKGITSTLQSAFNTAEQRAKATGARIKKYLTPDPGKESKAPKEKGGGIGVGNVTGVLAGAGIGAVLKGIVGQASDAQQSLGATETVFGKFAGNVTKTSSNAAKQFGLNANTYRENANLLGALLSNQGVSADQLAGKTEKLIGIGSDLAATYGGTTTEAVEGLSAAYKGEFDSLEKYGISLTQDKVNQEALAVAHVKTTSEFNKLTTAQQTAAKQQATTNLIERQSIKTHGAFAKETDTLAHKQQVFGAQMADFGAKIGAKLLPALTTFIGFLSEKLLPKIGQWANTFKTTLLPIIQTVAGWIKDQLQPPLTALGTWMSANGPTVKAFAVTVGILATAIGIWAAVQWLLNSALLASPVTWIVLGIAAIVAAVVYAWTHFEGFRKVVLGVWAGIQAAIGFAWNNVIKPVFTALSWFVTNVLGPAIGFLWNNIIKPYFTLIGNIIKGVWDRLIFPVLQALAWVIQNKVAPAISWFWTKVISPVFNWIGGHISDVWNKKILPVLSALGGFIQDKVAPAFQKGVSAIGAIWDSLKSMALAPVNFIIDTVYNKGIREFINKLPGVDDVDPLPLIGQKSGGDTRLGSAGRYATGGAVFGAGTATSDSIPAWLSNGEHVLTAKEVKAAGGHNVIKLFRQWLLQRGMGKTFDPAALPAFAKGGALSGDAIARAQKFAQDNVGDPYVWGGVGPNGFDCSGLMSAITNVIQGKNPYSRVGATGNFPWGGFQPGPGQFTIGSTKNYGGSGVGHMAGTLGGMNVESRGGRGVLTGSAARGYTDKGFDTVAHLGSTDTGGILGAVGNVLKNLKGWISELSNMGGFGGMISQMASAVVHNVVDFAKSKASFGIFDNGGILQPGGIAFNASKKPEAVFNHRQFAQYANDAQAGSRRPERLKVVIGKQEFDAYFDEEFNERYDDAANYRRT